VRIHLRKRPDVEACPGPTRDHRIELEEERIVLAKRDAARRCCLRSAVGAGVQRDHRDRADRCGDACEDVPLGEADEGEPDLALLAGL
jgi:hypothetical protein